LNIVITISKVTSADMKKTFITGANIHQALSLSPNGASLVEQSPP